jgi:hypothetical protein
MATVLILTTVHYGYPQVRQSISKLSKIARNKMLRQVPLLRSSAAIFNLLIFLYTPSWSQGTDILPPIILPPLCPSPPIMQPPIELQRTPTPSPESMLHDFMIKVPIVSGIGDCLTSAINDGKISKEGTNIQFRCFGDTAKNLFDRLKFIDATTGGYGSQQWLGRNFGNNSCFHVIVDVNGSGADDYNCQLNISAGDAINH